MVLWNNIVLGLFGRIPADEFQQGKLSLWRDLKTMAYAGPSRYTYMQNYKLKALSDLNFLIVFHERGEYYS